MVGLIVIVESFIGEISGVLIVGIWSCYAWQKMLIKECAVGVAGHLTLAPDFCSAKMTQVHWLMESLLEMYKGHRHGKTILPEISLGLL